jgi:hypothetical protein
LDLSEATVEFQTFEMQIDFGIKANHRGETAAEGLLAAADSESAL